MSQPCRYPSSPKDNLQQSPHSVRISRRHVAEGPAREQQLPRYCRFSNCACLKTAKLGRPPASTELCDQVDVVPILEDIVQPRHIQRFPQGLVDLDLPVSSLHEGRRELAAVLEVHFPHDLDGPSAQWQTRQRVEVNSALEGRKRNVCLRAWSHEARIWSACRT